MTLDPRLNPYRADLAAAFMRGKVDAGSFVDGSLMTVTAPLADMRREPRDDAGLDTQLLLGDRVKVFEAKDGWAWCQSEADGYVGYVPLSGLGVPSAEPTHMVAVPRTFVYPEPDMKRPHGAALSIGSSVAIVDEAETRGTRYAVSACGGALIAAHLRPVAERSSDFVQVAEELERTPYLWGGASAFGIDCSGLVQLCMRMAGRRVLRDTDMQAGSIGVSLDPAAGLRRGDLVFWKGHVGIMLDEAWMVHANGHSMMVSREPLEAAIARIGYLYGQPTGYRRP